MSNRFEVLMLRGMLAVFLLASCVGAARAQSPAEKLRSMHEAAQDSLQGERESASEAIASLRDEAKDALVGWLRRGSGIPSEAPSPRDDSEKGASQVSKTTAREKAKSSQKSGSERSTTERAASSGGEESVALTSAPKEPATENKPTADGGGDKTVRGEAAGENRAENREVLSAAVPASRRQAAAPYRSVLDRYAQRRDLPRTLLYAIADAESFFDPDAVSSAGAIGLMQVHPPTGGRLAWAAVHGTPQTPSKDHLTVPENNVRLATKLLQLLLRDFFGGVKNAWSRQLLATASYNAGASRVSEGLTEGGTVQAAVNLANRLSPRGMYERLRRTAPPETQTYVQRVFRRREHYAPWRGEEEVVYGIPEHMSSE